MDLASDWSGFFFDKYRLDKKLGNGSFGVVYKAWDGILKSNCALKIMSFSDPYEAKRLFSEAAIPYNCQHENIIKINDGDIINYGGTNYFVINMELANGCSVEDTMNKAFLSLSDSLNIAKNILFALEHSHTNNVIHRDIKPANILIDNGIPKLSDFGLAQALGSIVNPPRWYCTHTAPEVWNGNSVATVQTDIYAFGMTLFRMVNNYANWRDITKGLDIRDLTISGKLISTIGYENFVPEKIKRIIKKCCDLSPEKRFKSANDVRNEIMKLRPNIAWAKQNEFSWYGKNKDGKQYTIDIEETKSSVKTTVKFNGRRIKAYCKCFQNTYDANDFVCDYVKGTALL